MALAAEQIHLASLMHNHVRNVLEDGGGDEELLRSMSDYMGAFKRIMDTSTRNEMDELCARYSGFYRFGKLLEQLAEGIAEGRVEIPR